MQKFNAAQWVNPNIRSLKVYTSARDEYSGAPGIMLDANESPYNNGVNRYPDPNGRMLKEWISKYRNVDPACMVLGNGSDEVLDMIFKCCQVAGGNIVVPSPSYGMYDVLAATYGMETRKVLLDDGFGLNATNLLQTVNEQTRLIIVCSPNNPTGNVLAQEEIEKLLQSFKGLVVVDEAYIDFAGAPSLVMLLGSYPNLMVVQTFSKAFGMAGLRLGVGYASAEMITFLHKVKLPYNLNILTQQNVATQLQRLDKVVANIHECLLQRDLLCNALVQLPCVEKVYPSDANFLLVQFDDAPKVLAYLLQQGIVVRDRSKEPLCNNCLRITVGTPEEDQLLLKTLKLYEENLVYRP